jgi:hypothetical protein
MFASWKGSQHPYGGRISLGAYIAGVVIALVLGAGGIYIALIGLLVAVAVTVTLEGWVRYRREPSISDEPSRYPTEYH